ncbi:basic salivary proline-rich protein 2-like, partial [Cyprinodon tularosa]|uniref:basic salivary proline-rich protein 2-like n=1 Tax=Cyprinodon tularosa TaxID=77115 RepID=UPI0018E214C9
MLNSGCAELEKHTPQSTESSAGRPKAPGAKRNPKSEGTKEGPAPEIGPPQREEERQPPRSPPATAMAAPRGAAEASPRAPPATLKAPKHAPPPGTKPRRPQHPTRPHHPQKHTGGRAHSRDPRASAGNLPRAPRNPLKMPPRPKARPHPTKTDAKSAQRNTPRTELTQEQKSRPTARGADRSRRNHPPQQPAGSTEPEWTTLLPHWTKPEQHSRVRRPPSPPAQAPNMLPKHLRRPGPRTHAGRSHSNPHPPCSHTRHDQRDQSSSTMPQSGKTHPKTQSAQPADPHQPPNKNHAGAAQTPTHQRHAASRTLTQRGHPPRRKKNAKQKSPPSAT